MNTVQFKNDVEKLLEKDPADVSRGIAMLFMEIEYMKTQLMELEQDNRMLRIQVMEYVEARNKGIK